MHISIDDVKGCFKALSDEKLNSIFETRLLCFLKDMHLKYGTEFDLYCTYMKDGYSLGDVGSQYREEFEDNLDWLRFGFHCYSELEERGTIQFAKDVDLFVKEIERVTGQKNMPKYLRTHRFIGDKEFCGILTQKGVAYFLAADDRRNSYYLGKNEGEILEKQGYLRDDENEINFVKTAFRLENVDNVLENIEEIKKRNYPVIAVFTHERLMDSSEIRNKMETCCKYAMEIRKEEGSLL